MNTYDLIIIGSGPAGYTAAIYASRGSLKTLVLKGNQPGGQLTTTTEIENFPGFENGIDGNQLMMEMEKQAKRFGTELKQETVSAVDFSSQPHVEPHKVMVGETVYTAKAVIIASGASSRRTGAPGEDKLFAKGVSTCATCDGFFYKGKDVMILGGGDTAMEESLFLAKLCNSVTVVHRRNEFRASKIMSDRVLAHEKIKVIWDSEVVQFNGDTKLESVTLKNTKTGEQTEHITSGVFLAIGQIPNTVFLNGKITLTPEGYIQPGEHMQTNVPGVFYAGDVEDARYRQAITAAADGCKAAMEVEKYLDQYETAS